MAADSEIVELFCGRGNGLNALQRLGFTRLEGVDLSPQLIAQYRGPAKSVVADCRKLPFTDECKDVLIVQGGLHHLPALPDDLEQTFAEMQRVLRKEGRVVFVEPWLTPFLRFVHWVSGNPLARRLSNRMDALATMIHYERRTYGRMADPARVDLQDGAGALRPRARILRLGQVELCGHAALRCFPVPSPRIRIQAITTSDLQFLPPRL